MRMRSREKLADLFFFFFFFRKKSLFVDVVVLVDTRSKQKYLDKVAFVKVELRVHIYDVEATE